ncbi:MAG: hypothetical protein H6679_04830 [Epsilonproteobacteria bacterium]|nr:hypothetical protein [Campylobacterota bacterium]
MKKIVTVFLLGLVAWAGSVDGALSEQDILDEVVGYLQKEATIKDKFKSITEQKIYVPSSKKNGLTHIISISTQGDNWLTVGYVVKIFDNKSNLNAFTKDKGYKSGGIIKNSEVIHFVLMLESQHILDEVVAYLRQNSPYKKLFTKISNQKIHETSGGGSDPSSAIGSASNSTHIIFITATDNTNQSAGYVVKILRDRDGIDSEQKIITEGIVDKIDLVINKYKKKNTSKKLPIHVKYYETGTIAQGGDGSNDISFVLMSAAKGKPLDVVANNITNYSEQQLDEMGRDIGEQMGNLTCAYFTEKNSILRYGDPESQNCLYEPSEKQLYRIDLANTWEVEYEEDTPRLLGFSSKLASYYSAEEFIFKGVWFRFFERNVKTFTEQWDKGKGKHINPYYDSGKNLETFKEYRLRYTFAQAFYEGYYEAVKGLKRKDWDMHEDSFVVSVNKLKNREDENYPGIVPALKKEFKTDAQPIIDYLFAPVKGSKAGTPKVNDVTSLLHVLKLKMLRLIGMVGSK